MLIEEGRRKALDEYKLVAAGLGLTSVALLACGIVSMEKYPGDGNGIRYYIGGFTAGIPVRNLILQNQFQS